MHHYDNCPRVSSSLLIAFNATKQCLINSWLRKAVVAVVVVVVVGLFCGWTSVPYTDRTPYWQLPYEKTYPMQ